MVAGSIVAALLVEHVVPHSRLDASIAVSGVGCVGVMALVLGRVYINEDWAVIVSGVGYHPCLVAASRHVLGAVPVGGLDGRPLSPQVAVVSVSPVVAEPVGNWLVAPGEVPSCVRSDIRVK